MLFPILIFHFYIKKSHAIYFDSSCLHNNAQFFRGHRGPDRIIVGFTIEIMSLNPAHAEVYSSQYNIMGNTNSV